MLLYKFFIFHISNSSITIDGNKTTAHKARARKNTTENSEVIIIDSSENGDFKQLKALSHINKQAKR
jgi:hypothetical protein